jgi:hypothetical protein
MVSYPSSVACDEDAGLGGFTGRPHNDLLLALLHGFGLPEQTFGNPEYCTGPLPILV